MNQENEPFSSTDSHVKRPYKKPELSSLVTKNDQLKIDGKSQFSAFERTFFVGGTLQYNQS